MKANPLYENKNEMKLHKDAIYIISLHHMNVPEEKVARLYEIVLRRYKKQARVKHFLVVLAERRVEQLLRKWVGRMRRKD